MAACTPPHARQHAGFTLFEVLITLVVLGGVTALTVDRLQTARGEVRDAGFHARATAELRELAARLRLAQPAPHELLAGTSWHEAPACPAAAPPLADPDADAQWAEWLGQIACHLPGPPAARIQTGTEPVSGYRFWQLELRWRGPDGEWVERSTQEPLLEAA